MSWKKNAFSCLMWAAYLLIVGTAMVFTGRVICDSFGMGGYFEIIIPAGYLLFAGILVFALHWTAVRLNVGIRSPGEGFAWMEGGAGSGAVCGGDLPPYFQVLFGAIYRVRGINVSEARTCFCRRAGPTPILTRGSLLLPVGAASVFSIIGK